MKKQKLAKILYKQRDPEDRYEQIKKLAKRLTIRPKSFSDIYQLYNLTSEPSKINKRALLNTYHKLLPITEELEYKHIDYKRRIGKYTEEITLEDRKFGKIFLEYINGNILANVEEEYYSVAGQPHPHVDRDRGICFGDVSAAYNTAKDHDDIESMFDIAEMVVNNYYEDGAYQRLDTWDQPLCNVCQEYVGSNHCDQCDWAVCDECSYTCDICDITMCKDCYYSCEYCGTYHCDECRRGCECGQRYCAHCGHNCDTCGKEICKRDTHHGYCEECRPEMAEPEDIKQVIQSI